MKMIGGANLRSGGKSSIIRLLAERLNASILNFDKKRDAEHYNAINTINIQENKTITRNENGLILSDDTSETEIKSKSGYLMCDLGGYFDPRVIDLKCDYYIIPSFDDYESMKESMRTANYILKHMPKSKLIFVLNGAFIHDKKIRAEKIDDFNEQIEVNGLDRFPVLYLPYTKLMRKLVDYAAKKQDMKSKLGQEVRYPQMDKFIDELISYLK